MVYKWFFNIFYNKINKKIIYVSYNYNKKCDYFEKKYKKKELSINMTNIIALILII